METTQHLLVRVLVTTGILRNVRSSQFTYMYGAKQHNTKCVLCEKYNNCVKQHNTVLRREGNTNI